MSEADLVCAVIHRAVEDARLVLEIYKTKRSRNEAKAKGDKAVEWITSKKKGFMSFEWYCDLIDFSPDAIREKLDLSLSRNSGLRNGRVGIIDHFTFIKGET